MASFTFTNEKTSESEVIIARDAYDAARKLAFAREIPLSARLAAEGKIVVSIETVESESGSWVCGGKRYAVKYTAKRGAPLNTSEHYDSWQRNGRGEWVGPRS